MRQFMEINISPEKEKKRKEKKASSNRGKPSQCRFRAVNNSTHHLYVVYILIYISAFHNF